MLVTRIKRWLDRRQFVVIVVILASAAGPALKQNHDQAARTCEAVNDGREGLRALVMTISESPLITDERKLRYEALMQEFKEIDCG